MRPRPMSVSLASTKNPGARSSQAEATAKPDTGTAGTAACLSRGAAKAAQRVWRKCVRKIHRPNVSTLIEQGQEHLFYCSAAWQKKRVEILAADRYECQICKARGRYKKAELVHHVRHLRDHPELALSDTYVDSGGQEQRQLISVCKDCHEAVCHPERMRKAEKEKFLQEERWD